MDRTSGDRHDEEHGEERRDPLYREVRAMRDELKAHIGEEMPAIRTMMQELGSPEQVRERRIFIELLIERERLRIKLKTALIEKGLLLAFVALAGFVAVAVWHEISAAVKLMFGKQ